MKGVSRGQTDAVALGAQFMARTVSRALTSITLAAMSLRGMADGPLYSPALKNLRVVVWERAAVARARKARDDFILLVLVLRWSGICLMFSIGCVRLPD